MKGKGDKRKSFFKDKRLIQLLLFILSFFAIGNLWIWLRERRLNYQKKIEDEIRERDREKYIFPASPELSLTEWKCIYCKKVIKYEGNTENIPYLDEVRPKLIALVGEHLKECEMAQIFLSNVDAKKDSTLTYDDEETLKRKGYEERFTIERIRTWGLLNRVNLPDLNSKERVGVMKVLSVLNLSNLNGEEGSNNYKTISGKCSDELVFFLPILSPPITSRELPKLLEKDKFSFFFNSIDFKDRGNDYKKIVVSFFMERIIQKVGKWELGFFDLTVKGAGAGIMTSEGVSGTLSLYLALLSAYYQKPISCEVAATGFLNIGDYEKIGLNLSHFRKEIAKNPRENFSKNKISPVSGLEYKVPAAVAAGVRKLILSSEQKEDYEKVVPEEIKKQLKVYYVKNVEELEKLFWQEEFS